jgi:hypothetical protein
MNEHRSATASSEQRIEHLSRMPDCELAEGTPDVRGWDVTSPTSAYLGVVEDLLVDLASLRVRYLDVALDGDPAKVRRVLLPIGKVWINDALDEVVVPVSFSLDALPTYDPARFTREFEHEVLAAFGDDGAADFYMGSAFNTAAPWDARGHRVNCARRETDPKDTMCPVDDGASDATEAANGVELKVVPEAAD